MKNDDTKILERLFIVINQENRLSVLIVSLPGMMENLIKRTLINRQDVEVIGSASGGLSAVSLVQQNKPDLVIIESNFPKNEATRLVEWLKEESRSTFILVLVETTQQLKQASLTGVDLTLWSYTLPEKLDQIIEKIKSNLESGNGKINKGDNHAN